MQPYPGAITPKHSAMSCRYYFIRNSMTFHYCSIISTFILLCSKIDFNMAFWVFRKLCIMPIITAYILLSLLPWPDTSDTTCIIPFNSSGIFCIWERCPIEDPELFCHLEKLERSSSGISCKDWYGLPPRLSGKKIGWLNELSYPNKIQGVT
jgi:hypothetical protein